MKKACLADPKNQNGFAAPPFLESAAAHKCLIGIGADPTRLESVSRPEGALIRTMPYHTRDQSAALRFICEGHTVLCAKSEINSSPDRTRVKGKCRAKDLAEVTVNGGIVGDDEVAMVAEKLQWRGRDTRITIRPIPRGAAPRAFDL